MTPYIRYIVITIYSLISIFATNKNMYERIKGCILYKRAMNAEIKAVQVKRKT